MYAEYYVSMLCLRRPEEDTGKIKPVFDDLITVSLSQHQSWST